MMQKSKNLARRTARSALNNTYYISSIIYYILLIGLPLMHICSAIMDMGPGPRPKAQGAAAPAPGPGPAAPWALGLGPGPISIYGATKVQQ